MDYSYPYYAMFYMANVILLEEGYKTQDKLVHKVTADALITLIRTKLKKNKKIFKPLTLAAIIHNQFEDIHPFQDGNGRVGRLLLNYILIKNKYPPINFSLEDRATYYETLLKYTKEDQLRPTLQFLIKQYKKTLKKVTTKK